MQSKRDIIIKYTYKEHHLLTLHCIYMQRAILVRLIKDIHSMDGMHIIIFTNPCGKICISFASVIKASCK